MTTTEKNNYGIEVFDKYGNMIEFVSATLSEETAKKAAQELIISGKGKYKVYIYQS